MTIAPGFTSTELAEVRTIAKHDPRAAIVELDAARLDILQKSFGSPLTAAQLAYFAEVCKRTGLDPFRKQIYAVVRGGKMVIQTGIDGFRAIAQRSGVYEGQGTPMWCGPDGQWRDAWLEKGPPSAARVTVYRRGFREAIVAVARYQSYAQDNLWNKMPEVMLSKCAEALALRKAFPEDLSGLYTADEMAQADNDGPTHDVHTGEVPRIPSPLPDLLAILRKARSADEFVAAKAEVRARMKALPKGALSPADRAALVEAVKAIDVSIVSAPDMHMGEVTDGAPPDDEMGGRL
jgi:phage recombination protein Bet